MNRIILATLLMVFGCQNQADKISVHKLTPRTDYYLDQHPQIDTSKVILSSSYYQFIRLTDSTSTIKWGNKVISNLFGDTIDNFFIEKDRINLKWANEKFIVLGRSGGSDTWFRIILPLTKGANTYLYENLMAMDKENGIVVIEHAFDDSDTVLIAENILTRKRQIIGLDWEKCSSAMNHYCIDSISISKKQLYVEWTLPNKIDEPNATEIKRIRLDL